ncbi:MAG: glucose-fructose oxidoreductase [Citrobacter freundii]|nr:MAG: glucose-fructose oxidoreductase [Citrobacter freundii]
MKTPDQPLGIAVIGLGEYGAGQLIPALQHTSHCKLTGLVSGDPAKLDKYAKQYKIDQANCYNYNNFDQIAGNKEIDIVYIALPNSMHLEFTRRAADAGKHIICEKPMACSVEDCREMISIVQQTGVRFSMGYRLHFDPYNQEMMRLGQHEQFGAIDKMLLQNSYTIEPGVWRLKHSLAGGGPLVNNGIYCVQAAMYITGKLPIAVEATFAAVTDPGKFSEVEEGINWTMYFGNGVIAECETNYSKEQNIMRVDAEQGWFELSPAYEYEGLKGRSSRGEIHFGPVNQQARQMDDFARCIIEDIPTRVPAEMGLRDMEIITAIYESATTGKRIELNLGEFVALPEL